MMIELGKYTASILWSYGAVLSLLVGITFISILSHRRVLRALRKLDTQE